MNDPQGAAGDKLAGLRIVAFESRRATEMAELLRRHGALPISAPAMREVPLAENPAAHDFVRRLLAGEIDLVILLTGVGTRALVDAALPVCPRDRLCAALARIPIVARGPKPVAALRELGLTPALVIPEPNTWREILAATAAAMPVADRRVAVQEYGAPNPELIAGLVARGASVLRVPVYRWALPEDTGPLRAAARALAAGAIDIALFTSATQVEHLVKIADEDAGATALPRAFELVVVASIGPVCSDALRRHAYPVDLEPPHPKMGHLVAAVAAHGRALLDGKHRAHDLDPGTTIT
jgi:uroporphyrinogen-III synthase